MKKNRTIQHPQGQLRIIAGSWRGRKIKFSSSNIRPTPDRTRETLFNWLNPIINNATCLDLFAGSGALGFESLSRGAKEVIAVDQSETVLDDLNNTAIKLSTKSLHAVKGIIPTYKLDLNKKFDIVFIDPPFYKGLIQSSISWLIENKLLNQNARVYIEQEKNLLELKYPNSWVEIHTKKTANTKYRLFQVN